MYSQIFLVTSVRGIGIDPITAPRTADGFIGFMNAALGLRGFFGAAGFAAFLAGAFLAAALTAVFFAAGFFAADFLAAGFLATAFFFAVAIRVLQTVS